MVDLLVRDDAHRGLVVVVEGAERDELAALGLERQVVADQANDVRRVQDALAIVGLSEGSSLNRQHSHPHHTAAARFAGNISAGGQPTPTKTDAWVATHERRNRKATSEQRIPS